MAVFYFIKDFVLRNINKFKNILSFFVFDQNFLLLEEKSSIKSSFSKSIDSNDNTAETNKKIDDITENFDIDIMNASAKWTDNQSSYSLESINFNVRPGELVAIIGPVGVGKVCISQKGKVAYK